MVSTACCAVMVNLVAMGVDPKKVLIGDNGQIFEFDKDGGRKGGRVQAGAIFVDGLGVGDVGNIVIRDRQQLAQEGMVIVVNGDG